MFTHRFFILFIGCMLLALGGVMWHPLLTVAKVLVWTLAALTVIDAIVVFVTSRRLKASRKHKEQLSLDQPNPVTLTLSLMMPQTWSRLFKYTAYDTPPSSCRIFGQRALHTLSEMTYNVVPTSRGRHEFGTVRCFMRSRWLGLAEIRRFIDISDTVTVYPTFHHLEKLEMLATQTKHHGQQRMRRAGNSTEFDQIRPYVPGDDIRTINWRATARSASLMVNKYTDERSQPIIPILCAGPSMLIANEGITLLDRATSAAIALASSAIRHYDEAGLLTVTHLGVDKYLLPERSTGTVAKMLRQTCTFGLPPTPSERVFINDPDVLPDGIEQSELNRLYERMNACEADADYDALADYVRARIKRRSLLVLFANFENIAVARQAIPALKRMGERHKLVVVMFKNEGIENVAMAHHRRDTKVSSKLSEMRFRTVCADYIEQQELLAAYLRQQGINVLFTTPHDLTSAVLSEYLDLKNRAVI